MKFTYNWLKQYVDFDWSPQELAEKLTFAGTERPMMNMWSINQGYGGRSYQYARNGATTPKNEGGTV